MENLNKAIGHVIAKNRKAAGLSQDELAKEAKIHRTYVSQIERGLKSPTLVVLFQISLALKIDLRSMIVEFEQELHQ